LPNYAKKKIFLFLNTFAYFWFQKYYFEVKMQHFAFFIFCREENVLFASRYSILVVSTEKRLGESIDNRKP